MTVSGEAAPGAPGPSSWASTPASRASMLGNRRRDTQPELRLRRILHARGLRFRVDAQPVRGLRRRADLVFGPSKVAVFVDGCFWHGCPDHGTLPKSNADYWLPSVSRNVERDRETDALLQAEGWCVVRVWEHENGEEAADRVFREVGERRSAGNRT